MTSGRTAIYSSEVKEGAYRLWLECESLDETADSLGIPRGTVYSWSRSQGWAKRKISDAGDQGFSLMKSHIKTLAAGDADALYQHLRTLALCDDTERVPAKVQADIAFRLLALADIQPDQPARVIIDATPALTSTTSPRILSPDEHRAASDRLAAIAGEAEKDEAA